MDKEQLRKEIIAEDQKLKQWLLRRIQVGGLLTKKEDEILANTTIEMTRISAAFEKENNEEQLEELRKDFLILIKKTEEQLGIQQAIEIKCFS